MNHEVQKEEEVEKLLDKYLNVLFQDIEDDVKIKLAEEIGQKVNDLSVNDRKNFIIKLLGVLDAAASGNKKRLNNKQLEYISTAFNAMAFAEFGAFGYTALIAKPQDWFAFAFSAVGFVVLEAIGVFILSFSRPEEKRGA